jgi:hypothetical protein
MRQGLSVFAKPIAFAHPEFSAQGEIATPIL